MELQKNDLEDNQNNAVQEKKKSWIPLLLIALTILILWKSTPNWLDLIFPGIDKGQLENLFSPANALFSALALFGLIYTIIQQQKNLDIQRIGLSSTVKANETIVVDSKVTALINLYLFFYDTDKFGSTRKKATTVFRGMIQHEDYFHFVFNRGVKAARGYEPISEKHKVQFQNIYKSNVEMDFEDFKKIDSEYRDKLDDLMHFFNLLSVRNMPGEFFHKVDFNYDKWRQYLWWFAFKVEDEFNRDERLRKFCSLTTLSDTLEKLDECFEFKKPENLEQVLQFAIVRDTLNRKMQTSEN